MPATSTFSYHPDIGRLFSRSGISRRRPVRGRRAGRASRRRPDEKTPVKRTAGVLGGIVEAGASTTSTAATC